MIKTFKHACLEQFFRTGSKAGIQPSHEKKLGRLLAQLNVAASPRDMNLPGWRLHGLHGNLEGYFSVWVSANWRLTFTFEGRDAILVDYQDYH